MTRINLRFETTRTSAQNGFKVNIDSGSVIGPGGVPVGGIDFCDLPAASQHYLVQRGFKEAATDSLARTTTPQEVHDAIKRFVLALLAGTWGGKGRHAAAPEFKRGNPRVKIMLSLPGPRGESTYDEAIIAIVTKEQGTKPKTTDKKALKAWDMRYRELCADIVNRPATIARIDADIERLRLVAEENARRAAELLTEMGDAAEDLLADF